jgi:hypothetical protein
VFILAGSNSREESLTQSRSYEVSYVCYVCRLRDQPSPRPPLPRPQLPPMGADPRTESWGGGATRTPNTKKDRPRQFGLRVSSLTAPFFKRSDLIILGYLTGAPLYLLFPYLSKGSPPPHTFSRNLIKSRLEIQIPVFRSSFETESGYRPFNIFNRDETSPG